MMTSKKRSKMLLSNSLLLRPFFAVDILQVFTIDY